MPPRTAACRSSLQSSHRVQERRDWPVILFGTLRTLAEFLECHDGDIAATSRARASRKRMRHTSPHHVICVRESKSIEGITHDSRVGPEHRTLRAFLRAARCAHSTLAVANLHIHMRLRNSSPLNAKRFARKTRGRSAALASPATASRSEGRIKRSTLYFVMAAQAAHSHALS